MIEKTFTELWREGRQAEIRRLWQEQREREIRDAWRAGREAEAKKLERKVPISVIGKGCRFWPFGKGSV